MNSEHGLAKQAFTTSSFTSLTALITSRKQLFNIKVSFRVNPTSNQIDILGDWTPCPTIPWLCCEFNFNNVWIQKLFVDFEQQRTFFHSHSRYCCWVGENFRLQISLYFIWIWLNECVWATNQGNRIMCLFLYLANVIKMSDSIFEFSRDLTDILAQTNTNAYVLHTYFIHKLAYVLQLCTYERESESEIDEKKEIGNERSKFKYMMTKWKSAQLHIDVLILFFCCSQNILNGWLVFPNENSNKCFWGTY